MVNFNKLLSLFTASACICGVLLFSGCSEIEEDKPQLEVIENVNNYGSSYVYETLSEKEKKCYDEFAEGVENFETSIKLPEVLTPQEMRKIYVLVYNQEPQLFWLSSIFATPAGNTDLQSVSYRYTQEESQKMQEQINGAVSNIMSQFTKNADDYEKIRTIHDWIIKKSKFEKDTYYGNTVYGAVVDGKAQCEGYANAFSYVCDIAGIQNVVVPGTNANGETHVWNKVYINGSWYNVDLTWDDPILKYDDPGFIRHDYMMVTDEDIVGVTHFPDEIYFSHPQCVSNDLNYYTMEGLTADNAEEAVKLLAELVEKTAEKGGKDAEIRIADKDAYNKAVSQLFDNKEITSIFEDINSAHGTDISNAYKYNNDDLLIIHVSIIYK